MTFETDSKTEVFDRSRRDRKRVEILFAHLKRIFRLGRLPLARTMQTPRSSSSPWGQPRKTSAGSQSSSSDPRQSPRRALHFRGILRRGFFGHHCAFEEAAAAVACLVEKCIPMIDQLARRSGNLAGRTNVNVLLLVKAEVLPTEGSIPPEYAAPSSYP